MALQWVHEVPFSLHATNTPGPDGRSRIEWTDQWQTSFDDIHDADEVMHVAGQVAGLPKVGDAHPTYNDLLRCNKVQARRSNDCPTIFDVEIQWNTVRATLSTWDVTLQRDSAERAIDAFYAYDSGGNLVPILNSLKQAFDPTIKDTVYDRILTITFKTQTLQESDVAAVEGCINSDNISFSINGNAFNYPPNTVKLERFHYTTVWGQGLPFFNCEIKLHVNQETDQDGNLIGWTTRIADRGWLWVQYPMSGGAPNYGGTPTVCSPDAQSTSSLTSAMQVQVYLNGSGGLLAANTAPHILNYYLRPTAKLNPILNRIQPTTGIPDGGLT